MLIIEGEGKMDVWIDSEPAPWHVYAADIVCAIIGEGITEVGDYAFFGCSELADVTLPQSILRIGSFAFLDCVSLMSVEIPRSTVKIEEQAFGWCTGLEKVTVRSRSVELAESVFFMASQNFILHGYEGSTA